MPSDKLRGGGLQIRFHSLPFVFILGIGLLVLGITMQMDTGVTTGAVAAQYAGAGVMGITAFAWLWMVTNGV